MFRLPRSIFNIGSRGAFSLNLSVGIRGIKPLKFQSPSSWLQFRGYRPPPRFLRFSPQQLQGHFRNIRWDQLVKPALFTGAFLLIAPPVINYAFDLAPIFKRSPQAIVLSIIGINVGVFFAWRLPGLLLLLRRYALLVNDKSTSVWALLGSGFSHQSVGHLFVNMFCLQSFGSSLAATLGASGFLLAYLGSVVVASFFSLAFRTIARSGISGSLGASGGIFGLLGIFSYLFPNAGIALFFIPLPFGAWWLFLASFAANAAGMFFRARYDFAAHIGGSIAGIYYGWKARNDMRKRRRRNVFF